MYTTEITPKNIKIGHFYAVSSSSRTDGPDHYFFVIGRNKGDGAGKIIRYDIASNKAVKDTSSGWNLKKAKWVDRKDVDGRVKAQIVRKIKGSFEDYTKSYYAAGPQGGVA